MVTKKNLCLRPFTELAEVDHSISLVKYKYRINSNSTTAFNYYEAIYMHLLLVSPLKFTLNSGAMLNKLGLCDNRNCRAVLQTQKVQQAYLIIIPATKHSHLSLRNCLTLRNL